MHLMKKSVFVRLFACLCTLMFALAARAESPVRWSAKVDMSTPTEGVVVLTANIDKGWHLYGTSLPEDGPSATKLYYSGKGVKFVGNVKSAPKPEKVNDEMFGMELSYWEGKVTFTRKIQVIDPKVAEVTIKVDYMSCNDANCRPPVTEELTVKIPEK